MSGSQSKIQPLRVVSLALSIVSVCLAIAVIGTAADAYGTAKSQILAGNPWWLPLWPGHFNTGGLKTQIGAAIGVILFNGGFLFLCFTPKFSFHTGAFRTMFTAVLVTIMTNLVLLVSIVWSALLDRGNGLDNTIQTWTCRFSNTVTPAGVNPNTLDSKMTNQSFGKMCTETKFAFYTLVTIVILQAILFFVAIVQWAMAAWSSTKRQQEDDRPETGTELESQTGLKISQEFPKQNY